jgi:hypothetical protein
MNGLRIGVQTRRESALIGAHRITGRRQQAAAESKRREQNPAARSPEPAFADHDKQRHIHQRVRDAANTIAREFQHQTRIRKRVVEEDSVTGSQTNEGGQQHSAQNIQRSVAVERTSNRASSEEGDGKRLLLEQQLELHEFVRAVVEHDPHLQTTNVSQKRRMSHTTDISRPGASDATERANVGRTEAAYPRPEERDEVDDGAPQQDVVSKV